MRHKIQNKIVISMIGKIDYDIYASTHWRIFVKDELRNHIHHKVEQDIKNGSILCKE
jgi:hypothetical protein